MFIYNVTIHIAWPAHEAWVKWMKEKHIPEVMSSECFTSCRFSRLLDIDETEGPTYSIQYDARIREDYDRYVQMYAPALRRDLMDSWGENVTAFRSLMEVVN